MDMGRYVHYSILSCYINYCTVHPDADFECLAVLMEHTQDVKSVAWHPSREILASASYDDTIKLYIDDPDDDWYCFSTLTGHTSTVWSVSFSPNGSYLASGSEDCSVRIWKEVKENEWTCVLVLEGHERSVYSVSWGPGSSLIDNSNLGWVASTGGDGKINIWELIVRTFFRKMSCKHLKRFVYSNRRLMHFPQSHPNTH